MLLAAAEKGLGGCMIGNYNADSVKKGTELAENLAPVLIVAFGKPAEKIVIKEIEEGESIRLLSRRKRCTLRTKTQTVRYLIKK